MSLYSMAPIVVFGVTTCISFVLRERHAQQKRIQCIRETLLSGEESERALILPETLGKVPLSKRVAIVQALSEDPSDNVSRIGHALRGILLAPTYREAIPFLYELTDLIPTYKICRTFIPDCVETPFPKLVSTHGEKISKQLFFKNDIYFQSSLIIGTYYNKMGDPTFLLAYRCNETPAWGISLPIKEIQEEHIDTKTAPYHFFFINKSIAFLYVGSRFIYIYSSKTGALKTRIQLDTPLTAKEDLFHIHIYQNEYAYQLRNGKLYIGNVQFYTWKSIGEITPIAKSGFTPLSTHVGIFDEKNKKLQLIGPTGQTVTFDNCIDVCAENNKLYTIEVCSWDTNKCSLITRVLKTDDTLVSEPVSTITIFSQTARFGKLCNNGELWVLFTQDKDAKRITYVYLSNGLICDQYESMNFDNAVIDELGNIWSKDSSTTYINTYSPQGIISFKFSLPWPIRLRHVDSNGILYYTS